MSHSASLAEEYPLTDAKARMRQHARAVRAALSDEQRSALAESAAEHFMVWWHQHRPATVALYSPIRSELDTGPLAHRLRDAGVRLAFPRVIAEQGILHFAAVARGETMSRSSLGILEPPASARRVQLAAIEAFVVPGLAFDRAGRRLGWGGGYYDNTFLLSPETPRVGYAFDCQIVELVPTAPSDVPMTAVVTQSGFQYGYSPAEPNS